MTEQNASKYWQIPQRSRWEWFFMRLCFAAVVWWSLPLMKDMVVLDSQPYPTGIATLIDLTFFSNPAVYKISYYIFCAALLVYVSGFILPVVLPIIA